MSNSQRASGAVACSHVAVVAACLTAAMACGAREPGFEEDVDSIAQGYADVNFGIHATPGAAPPPSTPAYQAVPGWPAYCGWKLSLASTESLTWNFGNTMSSIATWSYWYNMADKAFYWEDGGDQAANSLETVDLFFTFTHGQAAPRGNLYGSCGTPPGGPTSDPADSTPHATWSMWNYQQRARSDFMRLGDEGKGLSFFVAYACGTLALDAYVSSRWKKMFKGGLRMSLGFAENTTWCAPDSCPAQFNHGSNFAFYLAWGVLVRDAWGAAFDDNDGWPYHPVAMASGNGVADCESRRDGMTWYNFRDYPRRRDSEVTTLCWTYWGALD